MDVSEKKLKALLAEQPHIDAAQLITGLILERTALKIKTRQVYGNQETDPSDPERW